MGKESAIQAREHGYKKLKGVLSTLTPGQIITKGVLGQWAVRDIIAHITAWNLRAVDEINAILRNDSGWINLTEAEQQVFNEAEVAKRSGIEISLLLKQWEVSSLVLIQRMRELSDEEWAHQDTKYKRSDESPFTVASIFDYKYGRDTHEGGHANQIAQYFKVIGV